MAPREPDAKEMLLEIYFIIGLYKTLGSQKYLIIVVLALELLGTIHSVLIDREKLETFGSLEVPNLIIWCPRVLLIKWISSDLLIYVIVLVSGNG